MFSWRLLSKPMTPLKCICSTTSKLIFGFSSVSQLKLGFPLASQLIFPFPRASQLIYGVSGSAWPIHGDVGCPQLVLWSLRTSQLILGPVPPPLPEVVVHYPPPPQKMWDVHFNIAIVWILLHTSHVFGAVPWSQVCQTTLDEHVVRDGRASRKVTVVLL